MSILRFHASLVLRSIIPERFRPIGYLERLTRRRTGNRVFAGPFAGTRYIDQSIGSAYIPKLIGTYELELSGCIEKACRLGFPLVVDVGAAEGYYAVGLARRLVNSRVVAFEMEERGREALKSMAEMNGVSSRIDIRGKCALKDLGSALESTPEGVLLICDVEGAEETLLQPNHLPELSRAYILAEMHDFLRPGLTALIMSRFSGSHRIDLIHQVERARTQYPFRSAGTLMLPRRYLDWAVSEWRPQRMSWLWMEPRLSHEKT